MERKRAEWRPIWSANIEAWTKAQIKKNMWRVDYKMEGPDDLLQEAQLLFHTLWRKYPIVKELPHFFALYKTSLHRLFHDKARKQLRSIETENVEAFHVEGNLPNCGYLAVLIEELPDELKIVLRTLTTGRPRRKLDRPPTDSIRRRDNLNARLKKRLSINLVDPVGDIKRVLRYNT